MGINVDVERMTEEINTSTDPTISIFRSILQKYPQHTKEIWSFENFELASEEFLAYLNRLFEANGSPIPILDSGMMFYTQNFGTGQIVPVKIAPQVLGKYIEAGWSPGMMEKVKPYADKALRSYIWCEIQFEDALALLVYVTKPFDAKATMELYL